MTQTDPDVWLILPHDLDECVYSFMLDEYHNIQVYSNEVTILFLALGLGYEWDGACICEVQHTTQVSLCGGYQQYAPKAAWHQIEQLQTDVEFSLVLGIQIPQQVLLPRLSPQDKLPHPEWCNCQFLKKMGWHGTHCSGKAVQIRA